MRISTKIVIITYICWAVSSSLCFALHQPQQVSTLGVFLFDITLYTCDRWPQKQYWLKRATIIREKRERSTNTNLQPLQNSTETTNLFRLMIQEYLQRMLASIRLRFLRFKPFCYDAKLETSDKVCFGWVVVLEGNKQQQNKLPDHPLDFFLNFM